MVEVAPVMVITLGLDATRLPRAMTVRSLATVKLLEVVAPVAVPAIVKL